MPDENRFKIIENALNALTAESRAHQIMIMCLVGQVASEAKDWRERLEVMRTNADQAVASFDFTGEGPHDAIRAHVLQLVNQDYDTLHRALVEAENTRAR